MRPVVSILLFTVLFLLTGILYWLHFFSSSDSQSRFSAPKIELKSSHVVYINTDTLWDRYEMVREIKKKLTAQRDQAESEFASKYQALANEEQNFREIASRLSEEESLKQQQDFLAKEQKLSAFREQMEQKLMKDEQEKNEQITRDITEYLKNAYKGSHYTYILGYTHGGGILFANDSLDITREVVQGINRQYKLSSKK
jgi:outer membrane protein